MSSISPNAPRQGLQFGGHRAGTQKSAFQKENEAVLKALAKAELQMAEVSGGKGGFCTATVDVNGTPKTLFLKPIDEYEFSNYSYVQNECKGNEDDSILKYMPRVYGKFENFMVMENLRTADDKQWKQIADLKISAGGQSDDEELQATKRPKGTLEKGLMKTQDSYAPNFLFLVKSKVMRSVNAIMGSEEIFVAALKKESLRPETLKKVRGQLVELNQLLTNSPMAFIGCSIFIFVSKDGKDVKVRLADPAHGIARPGTESKDENVFYAFHDGKFDARLAANKKALGEMIACVSAALSSVKAKDVLQENARPRAQTEQTLKIGSRRNPSNLDNKVHQFSEIELEELRKEYEKGIE